MAKAKDQPKGLQGIPRKWQRVFNTLAPRALTKALEQSARNARHKSLRRNFGPARAVQHEIKMARKELRRKRETPVGRPIPNMVTSRIELLKARKNSWARDIAYRPHQGKQERERRAH